MALTDKLTAIANSIRGKTGESSTMTLDQMPTKITNIPTGITPTGTINITTNGTHDVTNYASANVSVGSVNTYKIATGTITPNSGHMYITHNLNSTKLIVMVQGRINTKITSQYKTIAGTWFSDDFLADHLTDNLTYDVSEYSSALPDGLIIPFEYFAGHSICAGTATQEGPMSTPNVVLTTSSDNYSKNKIICTDANNVQVYARYTTQTDMVFDYVVIAF